MHQQPRATEHPLALNKASRSGQRSRVSGCTVSFMEDPKSVAHLESNVHMPTPMKPTPASTFNVMGETNLSSCPPTITPIPAATTNAAEAPENTSHLLAFASEEKSTVASCVLSPISARKIVTKTEKNVCQATF